MKRILVSALAVCLTFAALSVPFQPAHAQATGPISCSDNSLVDDDAGDDPCTAVNPFCQADHGGDMGTAAGCVDSAISYLNSIGWDMTDNSSPPGPGNCGPGRIIEEAVACMRAAGVAGNPGLLFKSWGNNCDNHSVDVVVFDDGCAFDIVIGSGDPTQARGGSILLCCGNPPCQTRGCCTDFNDRYCWPAPC